MPAFNPKGNNGVAHSWADTAPYSCVVCGKIPTQDNHQVRDCKTQSLAPPAAFNPNTKAAATVAAPSSETVKAWFGGVSGLSVSDVRESKGGKPYVVISGRVGPTESRFIVTYWLSPKPAKK